MSGETWQLVYDRLAEVRRAGLFLGVEVVTDRLSLAPDAELADRMRESENRRRKKTGPGQRHGDGKEGIEGRGTQRRGHFQRPLAHRLESRLQRLHHEGQRIKHRGNDQTAKSERQRRHVQRLGELPHRAAGPHRQQQIKAQHRRRQHQGQGHHRTNGPLPA